MFEQEVRSKDEILEIIQRAIHEQNLTLKSVEIASNLGQSSMSKWNKSDPSIVKVLAVLESLNIKIVLRTDSLDQYIESSDETKERQVKEIQTEITDELIALNLLRLFKKNISLENKKRLLEFLAELLKE